jgi:NifU-like protein involved in Fe-S cluster formation
MVRFPEIIGEHFADPYHCGVCEGATHIAQCVEAQTSCHLQLELIVRDERVREAWFIADGCECCEGLASLLAEHVEGKQVADLGDLSVPDLVGDEGLDEDTWPACRQLPLATLRLALDSPLDLIDRELGDFSGPSLSEEC